MPTGAAAKQPEPERDEEPERAHDEQRVLDAPFGPPELAVREREDGQPVRLVVGVLVELERRRGDDVEGERPPPPRSPSRDRPRARTAIAVAAIQDRVRGRSGSARRRASRRRVEMYAPLIAAYPTKTAIAATLVTTKARVLGSRGSSFGRASAAMPTIIGRTPIPIASAPIAQTPCSTIRSLRSPSCSASSSRVTGERGEADARSPTRDRHRARPVPARPRRSASAGRAPTASRSRAGRARAP